MNEYTKVVIRTVPAVLGATQAAEFVALSMSTMEKLIRQGRFPRPRQLSDRRVGFLLYELQDWIETRPESLLPLLGRSEDLP